MELKLSELQKVMMEKTVMEKATSKLQAARREKDSATIPSAPGATCSECEALKQQNQEIQEKDPRPEP